MNLSDEVIKQLEQGMKGYNPVAYELMGKVETALVAVGIGLAVLFFWFDFEVQAKAFEEAGTSPDSSSYAKLVMKYVMVVIAIMNSAMIMNFILWIAIQITKWSHSVVGASDIDITTEAAKGMWGKVISLLSGLASIVANLIIKVLMVLRFVQMYLFKGLAPIMIAFFAQKDLRQHAISFLKRFGGYALQGVVLLLTVAILAALQKSLITTVDDTGTWLDSFKGTTKGLVQAVVSVIAVLGTQKTAKEFLQ